MFVIRVLAFIFAMNCLIPAFLMPADYSRESNIFYSQCYFNQNFNIFNEKCYSHTNFTVNLSSKRKKGIVENFDVISFYISSSFGNDSHMTSGFAKVKIIYIFNLFIQSELMTLCWQTKCNWQKIHEFFCTKRIFLKFRKKFFQMWNLRQIHEFSFKIRNDIFKVFICQQINPQWYTPYINFTVFLMLFCGKTSNNKKSKWINKQNLSIS